MSRLPSLEEGAARVHASLAALREEPEDDDREGEKGLVTLAEVAPQEVQWLWPGRIPLGRLTILDGDPGTGKSTLSLDLAARVSRGDSMPDGSPGLGAPAGVILLTCEDGLADTIRPRLDAAGADCARVHVRLWVEGGREEGGRPVRRLPTVRDVLVLEGDIRTKGARLLIIDPLVAYLGGADGHRDAEVRGALAGIAELAERTGCAILAIRHLRKTPGGNPLYAGGGSIAFIAAARSALLLARDPEDPSGERLVLAATKHTLCRRPPSLALRVVEQSGGGTGLEWLGESGMDAERLLEREDREERTAREEAVEWLRAALAQGPRPAREVQREAQADGIAERTLQRARKALGVVAERVGEVGKGQRWEWRFSEFPEMATPCGHLGRGHLARSVVGVARRPVFHTRDGQALPLGRLGDGNVGNHGDRIDRCARGCGAAVGRAGVVCGRCQVVRDEAGSGG